MAENPLLPHRKLRELHALMLRCRELDRRQKIKGPAREALLAATSMHLLPGDLLSARVGDLTAAQLAPEGRRLDPADKKPADPGTLPPVHGIASRIALGAAAAKGLRAAGTDGLMLSYTQAGWAEPGWKAALEWAQAAQLPLLLACSDATGGKPSRKTVGEALLTFRSINHLSARTRLAVLTVDGEDAVAVYRVMQECVLRARLGGGPAVIWAVMSAATGKLAAKQRPVARLESYLAARKISLG